jgi:hypothetical protein
MSDHGINVALLVIACLSGIAELGIFWMILQDYRKARGVPELPTKRLVLLGTFSLGPLAALLIVYLFASNARSPAASGAIPPAVTAENIDQQIRQWIAEWPWYSVKTLPENNEAYFTLQIDSHDARRMLVTRPKRIGEHLTISGVFNLSADEQASIKKLSPVAYSELIHNLRIEMARARMPYVNIGLPLQAFEIGRNIPIEGLTAQKMYETLNDMDLSIILCWETIGREVDAANPAGIPRIVWPKQKP